MSRTSISQWPYLPTDSRPLFYKPHSNTQKPPVRKPRVYADRQARKRRRSEANSGDNKASGPESSESFQQYFTNASYLASQTHLARKVRITPALLVNQNLQRFRISDIGDPIVDWASERLRSLAPYLGLPWHYLQYLNQLKPIILVLQGREEKITLHTSDRKRVGLGSEKYSATLSEEARLFMEECKGARQPRVNNASGSDSDDELHQHDGSDVEMKDAPAPSPPRRNHSAMVQDAEEDSLTDLCDDEIEGLMELNQQYHAYVDDCQSASSIPQSRDTSRATFPDVANESASDHDGSDSDNDDNDLISSPESNTDGIQPPPALVLLPSFLVPARVPGSLVAERRAPKKRFLVQTRSRSPIQMRSRTHAEYDRLQSWVSSVTPRKARYTALKSPVTSSPLFAPFLTSNGVPISFKLSSTHEPTRTSMVWKEVMGKTKPASPGPKVSQAPQTSLSPAATSPARKNIPAGETFQVSPTNVSASSSAKFTSVLKPEGEITSTEIKTRSPQSTLSEPVTPPAQSSALPSNIFARLNATPNSDPPLKKGLGDSIFKKKKAIEGSA
jgi:hypothetical protein